MTAPTSARGPVAAGAAPATDRQLRDEVLRGLLAQRKTLPPKLFYDVRGAALFERICALEEYYVTRAELAILRQRAGEIAHMAGPRCTLVEYGSGAGVKVRLLLDRLAAPAAYVPIDISREQLARVSAAIAADYPAMVVRPLCGDYTRPLRLPPAPHGTRSLAFFPGSTIGNFHPGEATAFLRGVRAAVGAGGALVLGVDRRKDAATLRAAYDDREGVTAAFNLNVLARLNRELGADFDPARFRHRAVWDDAASRIEMHLESVVAHAVRVAGVTVRFARGETIWTESSYKYDRPSLHALVAGAGFRLRRAWTDERRQFWVVFLTVPHRRARHDINWRGS